MRNLDRFYIGDSWNWPMNQLIVKATPCLAAGYTMVAKPSEHSPLSAVRFAELVHEAGFLCGVYTNITGAGTVAGEARSRHPDWDAHAPFGGFKQSGNGREHSVWGLHDYHEVKSTAGYA